MADLGTFPTDFEIQVKLADGKFQTVAKGKLDLPVVADKEGSSGKAVTGVKPALAEAFEFVAESLRKDGS